MMKFRAMLIASLALGTVPVAAETALRSTSNADKPSTWLIMKEAVKDKGVVITLGIEKLEMKDMEQCEEQGAIFMSSNRLGIKREKYSGFECLEGK